jgi:hypothetical protein
MASWKYTCNIPLWILGKDAEGDSVAVSAWALPPIGACRA